MQLRWGVLLAAPAVIGFAVFTIVPMVASFVVGLTDWTVGNPLHFIGLQNYAELVQDGQFWDALQATGLFTIMAVPLSLAVALFAALLLSAATKFVGLFRILFYIPVLVPPVANAVLWLWLFNPDVGLLNQLLALVGIPPLQWIYSDQTALLSLAIMTAWGFGNTALIFLAGLKRIPTELYEAAECDGAGVVRRFWSITVPQLSPVILFNLVMGIIASLQVFDQAYVMTQGGPDNTTLFLVFYLYQEAFKSGRLGYASATAWVLFAVIVLITIAVFRFARRFVFYQGEDR